MSQGHAQTKDFGMAIPSAQPRLRGLTTVVMDQSAPASPGMSLLPLLNPTNPKFPASLPQLGCRTSMECRKTSFLRPISSLSLSQSCSRSPWLGSKVSMPQTTGKRAGLGFLSQPGTFPNRSSESHTCHGKGSKAEATPEKESGRRTTKKLLLRWFGSS